MEQALELTIIMRSMKCYYSYPQSLTNLIDFERSFDFIAAIMN